jgi:FAD/FMN-containing dehydrogenase
MLGEMNMRNLNIKTIDGDEATFNQDQLTEFESGLRGRVIYPDQHGYDQAREIWNGIFDKKPAVVVRCVGTGDVVRAVNFIRENRLLSSVKGGGHNSAGTGACDDGVMIDLSLMRSVTVDRHTKTVRVDGGALLGDVDHETQLYGLAVSGGIISHTGVGGLTLGGGYGWIGRKYGMTIDNLISAEVVTAKGEVVTASAGENPDLFWAVRGGGGNFGIVTKFEFKCAPIGNEVLSGLIVKRFEDAGQYLQFHRDYVRKLPDEMSAWIVVRHAPPLPFLPEEVHGKRVVVVASVWLGSQAEGEELLKPIREATPSHGEWIGMNPWTAWQSGFDALVDHGARNYWKSHQLTDLSDGCIEQVIQYAEQFPSEECEIFIPHLEGAQSRVPEDATAFAHRKTPFLLNIHTRWQKAEDDDLCLAWVKDFHDATREFADGVYVNFMSQEGEARVKEAYTPAVWDRLVKIKTDWDPDNLFRMNQNITPAAT